MQQRQYRPGDVLDDYCPRERRITNHAIVAMVEDQIHTTRCAVCESEHDFKNAKLPAPRRKNSTAALFTQVLDNLDGVPGRPASQASEQRLSNADTETAGEVTSQPDDIAPVEHDDDTPAPPADDRPFRRSLIRAQLPRPEGQPPATRAIPEFTMHQPLNNRAKRPAQGRFRRRPAGGFEQAGPMRSGREQGNGSGNPNGNGQAPGHGGRRRRRKKH
jgi:hypothetical protein